MKEMLEFSVKLFYQPEFLDAYEKLRKKQARDMKEGMVRPSN